MEAMKAKIKIIASLIILFFIPLMIIAEPRIESVVMTPSNPSPGDTVNLVITYCGQLYNNHDIAIAFSNRNTFQNAQLSGSGQVFVVSDGRFNIPMVSASPGGELGYLASASPGGSATQDCTVCTTGMGHRIVLNYTVDMPDASYFPGCNNTTFYLMIAMRDSNLNEGVWDDDPTGSTCNYYRSAGWSIPTLPPDFTIRKRAEGVLQDADPTTGDLVVFSIDYEYWDGQLVLTDVIPTPPSGAWRLESYGPTSMFTGGPAIGTYFPPGSGSNTLTWTLPNRSNLPGKVQGTVWYLMRMTTDIPDDTVIQNTVNGRLTANSGPYSGTTVNHTHATNITVGRAVIALEKDVASTNLWINETVTYYLNYSINGSKLINYEPFDDIAVGTYTATAPSGWQFVPQGGTNGTWSILDECGTGDYVIRGATNPVTYPGLTITGPPFCLGTIVTDVKMGASYEGADGLVIIRNNNLIGAANRAYALVVSVDPGGGPAAQLAIQKCGSSCSWFAGSNAVDVQTNTWYRVKVEAVAEYQFRAKVWKKGDPEPGWAINWTDPAPASNGGSFGCADPGTWTPGIAEQGGDDAAKWVNDYYNNFMVYQPRASAATILYDTIPTGVTYIGSSGPTAGTLLGGPNRISWYLGTISNESGSYTWWGRITTCDPITNKGSLSGTGTPRVATVDSNEVVIAPQCPTPVITLTKSHSPAGPISPGNTVTWTLQTCNSAAGPTANPMTVWDTIPTNFVWVGGDAGYGGSTAPGGVVYWDIAPLNASACVTRRWWGTWNGTPMNPFGAEEYFFAYMYDTARLFEKFALIDNNLIGDGAK